MGSHSTLIPHSFQKRKDASIPPTQIHSLRLHFSLSLYLHAFIYFSTLAEDSLKHPQDSFGRTWSSTWRVGWSLYNQASVQRLPTSSYAFICFWWKSKSDIITPEDIFVHMTTELFEPIFWAANAITVEPQENDIMKILIDTTRTHTEPNLLQTILRSERLLRVWQEPRTNFHSLFKKYRLTFGLVRGFPTCIIPPVWIYSDATTTLLEWTPSTKQTTQSVW